MTWPQRVVVHATITPVDYEDRLVVTHPGCGIEVEAPASGGEFHCPACGALLGEVVAAGTAPSDTLGREPLGMIRSLAPLRVTMSHSTEVTP